MTSLHTRIDALEVRLQDGYEKIGEAMDHGIEVENWERTWVDLLRQYEDLSDELAAAQPEQV
ncbi:MAG: hypothetical protein KC438_11735, partial [Thermomicrobiales bacterium]|nr:hypothetical protein [Thermomicrobiales bacterium]